jgi:hypothetical protein
MDPTTRGRHLVSEGSRSELFARPVQPGHAHRAGPGVEKDRLKALNLYRRAWGVGEDDLSYAAAARREQAEVRAELEKSLAEKDLQLQLMRKQLQQLQQDVRKTAGGTAQVTPEIDAMRTLLAKLEAERVDSAGRLASLPSQQTREPIARESVKPLDSVVEPRLVKGMITLLRADHRQPELPDPRKLQIRARTRNDRKVLHDKYFRADD